jgi:uncharacterized protein
VHAGLSRTDHRPYPPPRRPWSIFMRWHGLLFMHWAVDVARLRAYVPPGLVIDTFGGRAWLGVVPFTMTGIRHRLAPPIPGLSAFPELNVRTYVRAEHDGRAGVWFFSLDAASRAAVSTARAVFGLAYMNARMSSRRAGEWIEYRSHRTGPHTSLAYGTNITRGAEFVARYRASGPGVERLPGSLEDFFTARYCLYAWRRGRLVRGEIHHEAWKLSPAEAETSVNTTGAPLGVDLGALSKSGAGPLLHYAPMMDVIAWTPELV